MSLSMKLRITAVVVLTVGLAQAGHAQEGRWELLGTAHVDGRSDHDNIVVGRQDGRFRAIQLRVKGSAIEFGRVVVHYGNGEPEEIFVRARIPAGGVTRAIELRGGERFIRSLELWYGRGSWGRRRPEVLLYGLR
jgi:hypothetical protein